MPDAREALTRLAERIGSRAAALWLEGARVVRSRGRTELRVPRPFAKQRLESRYAAELREVLGEDAMVVSTSAPEAPPKKHERRAMPQVTGPRAEFAVRAVRAFAEKAETTSEGWKRFRNPELKPLFLKLLDHPDWRTAHRALFALEYYRDPAALGGAWRLLFHAEPRMREKAAIACIKLWDAGAAKDLSQGDWRGALDALLTEEKDLHVRRCLEALKRRTEGKLPVVRVHEEFTVRGPDGLLLTPFLEGMDKARQVAPGYAPKGSSLGGGGSAAKLPVVETWTTPVLGYGREEVPGTGLQPFANPRENGVVHTGQDLGACLDGAATTPSPTGSSSGSTRGGPDAPSATSPSASSPRVTAPVSHLCTP